MEVQVFLFAIMIFVSLYGMAKYKKNTEGIVSRNTLENWIAGAHSGVLHIRQKVVKILGTEKL